MITALIKAGRDRFGSEGRFAQEVGLSPQQLNKRKQMTVVTSLEEGIRMAIKAEVSLDELAGLPIGGRSGGEALLRLDELIDEHLARRLGAPPAAEPPWTDARPEIEQALDVLDKAALEVRRALQPDDKERKRGTG